MKYAVIGTGKTGAKVLEILKEKKENFEVFDSKNTISKEKLKDIDIAIIFIPGEVFENQIEMLLDSNIPIISGSTGHKWPEGINQTLQEKKITWIFSRNFAPGMSLIHKLLIDFNKISNISTDIKMDIKEIHHTKKLDAPSGTAIAWGGRLTEHHVEMESERIGDEVGFHQLTLSMPHETITLSHKSHNRKVFAHGAYEISKNISLMPHGLINYEDYLLEQFNK